jgi:hypothetical protein
MIVSPNQSLWLSLTLKIGPSLSSLIHVFHSFN